MTWAATVCGPHWHIHMLTGLTLSYSRAKHQWSVTRIWMSWLCASAVNLSGRKRPERGRDFKFLNVEFMKPMSDIFVMCDCLSIQYANLFYTKIPILKFSHYVFAYYAFVFAVFGSLAFHFTFFFHAIYCQDTGCRRALFLWVIPGDKCSCGYTLI